MKNIKVNGFTIYFLLLLFLCGYIKLGIIIFGIVIFHEFGHFFVARLLNYEITDITIYPFGGISHIEKDLNTPIKDEILIAIAGVSFQLVLGVLVYFLPFSINTQELFFKYNIGILLFNLLPIIPLDGSIILKCILNKFFSFKMSYILYIILSIVFIIIYVWSNFWFSLNNYLMITLFLYKLIDAIKNYKYIFNRFLLERHLHDYNFKYLSTKKGDINILKLDTYQYFKDNNKITSEKEKLRELFDKKRYF